MNLNGLKNTSMFSESIIEKYNKDSEIVSTLVVDTKYPEHYQILYKDMQLLPEKST